MGKVVVILFQDGTQLFAARDGHFDAGFALPGQEIGFRLRLNGYWANGRPAAAIRIVRNAIPRPEEMNPLAFP